MRSSSEFEKTYTDSIKNRINAIMAQQNIKQLELSERTNIGQPTLSKLLKGDMNLTLQHILKISYALNIEPSDLLALDKNLDLPGDCKPFPYSFHDGILNEKYVNELILIRDTKHPCFNGYKNVKFNFYCYPTISTESALLEGELLFTPSEKTDCCLAHLDLCIGKLDKENFPIKKKYDGELLISLSMGACYCILANPDNGELITLNFNHMFFNHQDMVCRMATMVSTSSGGNRLPVMQRALLSQEKLYVNGNNADDLDFVKGQLNLNESSITISHKKFQQLKDNNNPLLQSYFEKCEQYLEPQDLFTIEESKIRNIDEHLDIKAEAISLLRNASTSAKYNKISTKTDEFLYQYIENKYLRQTEKS